MQGYFMTTITVFMLLLSSVAMAELNGTQIVLKSGDHAGVNVPVEIALETDEAPAMIEVVCSESGKKFPATLRDGKLTFLMEKVPANAERTVTIAVSDRPDDKPARVMVTRKADEDIVDVVIDGVHFTSYHYSDDWKKPFLWPVNCEGGVCITRNYPMDREGTPRFARDHPHHKSVWSAYGEVNDHDFWGEGSGSGNQVVKEVTFGSGDAYGWILSVNVWEDKDGTPIIKETREYRFYATPDHSRLFDTKVTFSAEYGEVLFSDTKEGGIVSARMRADICGPKGIITNALGDVGERNAWGKPSPWCDFSGDIKDVGMRGLTIFDHPGNLRHPSSWHVRTYGLMGANAFGYSYFSEKEHNKGLIPENGDYTFAANDVLTFNYRIYVHSGTVEEAAVAARYSDYANAPAAALAQ